MRITNPAPLFEVQGLCVRYGANIAVQSIDLFVNPSEVVALIGANGAGKSSILKALIGVIPASSAGLRLGGADLAKLPTRERIRHGIALSPEGRAIFPRLTVLENLNLGYIGREAGVANLRLESVLEMFPKLGQRRTQLGGTLSGGEQQMLAIGRALMAGPKLLLLDEPTLGLAPIIVTEIAGLIQRLAQSGLSVIIGEQNAAMALSVSTRSYVLANGRQVLTGPSSELLENAEIRRAYLGL